MFHKMRHALLVFKLVARAGIYGKPAVGHLRGCALMDDAQSVGQGKIVENPLLPLCYSLHSDVSKQFEGTKIVQTAISTKHARLFLPPAQPHKTTQR